MSSIAHQHHVEECPSCGAIYKGKYCHSCGEKVFHPSDLALKKFIAQTVDIFTHFDSKFIRSVKYLMLYPGYLVKAYVTGNRVKYAKPMQLFLLSNLIFFFLVHLIGVTDFSPNMGDQAYGGLSNFWLFQWAEGLDNDVINWIDHMAISKQIHMGLGDADFYKTFYENSWIYSKTFIIMLIPVFSILFWAVFAKRFKYFGSALVFGIYFLCFQMLAFCIVSFILMTLHIKMFMPYDWLLFSSPLKHVSKFLFISNFEAENMLVWVPYIYFAIQRVHKRNVWLTIALSFLLGKIVNFLTFVVYKKAVIVLTLLLMHHT